MGRAGAGGRYPRGIGALAREALARLGPLWDELFPAEHARIVRVLVEWVDVGPNGADSRLRTAGLAGASCATSPAS